DPALRVNSANTLEDAETGQISFLANSKYAKQLTTTNASAVIVAASVTSDRVALLRSKDPYYAFRQAVVALHGFRRHPHEGVHPAAHVDPSATVGAGTVVYPGVYIGPGATIGRECILYANAVIYDGCAIGDRVIVHANATIGADGYGFATQKGVHHKIPQVGNVVIEDDCEIGANATIDRAALGSTRIGKGSKLGDLITIGHNTQVGPGALLVAQVGIAGSTTLGHHVTMAGQVGVAGHLKIGDNATIGAQSGIITDVPEQSTLVGAPAMPIQHARRVYLLFTQLPELAERLKKLEEAVGELGEEGAEEAG
ncbi:MAG TPA: UDP-3-O-(3-hydroxymyristoyl)glucosamine N-acyltransferase, partial [Tepidisphaeraceae bacterium]|nr:UDP-3-O-(3-hydroxymyristoyl)glucosamine N-acyltransferase [Tepidisphaeraceae bacterium]